MDNENSTSFISIIIGLLFALMLAILSSLGFFSIDIVFNPYLWAIVMFVILGLLFLGVYMMNNKTKKYLKNVDNAQKKIVRDAIILEKSIEERFKIYDRLSKLEFEVYYGKKRSN